jgi:putative membrane protein
MIPKTILQNIKGSILPSIWQRVLIMMLFALMVTIFYLKGFETLSQPVFASLIPGVVLGLLLVFRTNTAYERFWEGRKLVGGIVIGSRQLSRQILVTIPENSPEDYASKREVTRLLVAFFVALKLHLRQEPIDEQLSQLVSEEQAITLRNTDKMPLKIIQWINDRMMHWYRQNYIDSHLFSNYIMILDQLVERMAGCERIRNTPVPRAYSMHLNHLLLRQFKFEVQQVLMMTARILHSECDSQAIFLVDY